ncbi:MAG: hypothetical protein WCP98_21525 [Actinomycetes bacterium]
MTPALRGSLMAAEVAEQPRSLARGHDPDAPRGLRKVTETH